jgi:hypothetical protein
MKMKHSIKRFNKFEVFVMEIKQTLITTKQSSPPTQNFSIWSKFLLWLNQVYDFIGGLCSTNEILPTTNFMDLETKNQLFEMVKQKYLIQRISCRISWNKKRKLLDLEKEPILLLQDSMSSHINGKITPILETNKIDHYEFPAHVTHLTQPLDGTIFSGWKNKERIHTIPMKI